MGFGDDVLEVGRGVEEEEFKRYGVVVFGEEEAPFCGGVGESVEDGGDMVEDGR